MATLTRNVIANAAGSLWTALMSLVFVPLYIHFLGMEAWGLVGCYTVLQSVLAIADLGMSTTLNREIARSPAGEDRSGQRDLVRTLEVLYWAVAIAGGLAVILLAPYLAGRWLVVQHLPVAAVRQALQLMGVALALQLPYALYAGGLMGQHDQVRLNGINVGMATVRSLGMIAVLAFVSPTITAYFIWQVVISAAHTGVVALQLWRNLRPAAARPRFRQALIAPVWRFSAGVLGITVSATLLTQLDRLVLSRVLPLEMFGYYVLAAAVAANVYVLTSPLFLSCFPKFTALVSSGEHRELTSVYHGASQVLTVFVAPVVLVVAAFSYEILLLWTHGDLAVAGRSHLILTLLIIGAGLDGLTTIPYTLQLAHGWTRLTVWVNVVALALLCPLVIVLGSRMGGVGAAAALLGVNLLGSTLTVTFTHRRFLPAEGARWYIDDIGKPLVAAAAVVLAARAWLPWPAASVAQVAAIGSILAGAIIAAAAVTPSARRSLRGILMKTSLAEGRTLLVVLMIGIAVPAYAQTPRPERPYRGLFGGGVTTVEQSLTFNATMGGGQYWQKLTGGDIDPAVAARSRRGQFGQALLGLNYSLKRSSVGVTAGLTGSTGYYPKLPHHFVTTTAGNVGTSFQITSGTKATVDFTATYQPFYFLAAVPGLFDQQSGALTALDQAAGEHLDRYLSTTSGAGLMFQLTKATSLSFGYQERRSASASHDRDMTMQGANGRLTVGLMRGLGLKLGYGYQDSVFGREGTHTRGQNIDAGLDLSRDLSITRRLKLSFGSGMAGLSDGHRTRYFLTGNIGLTREIGRTWAAGLTCNRGVSYIETFRAPTIQSAVTVSLGGLITRRAQFQLGGGAASGNVGLAGSSGYKTTFGTTGLSFGLSRDLAIGLSYGYYRYSFQSGVDLPPGMPRRSDRQSVQLYLTFWQPIFQSHGGAHASR